MLRQEYLRELHRVAADEEARLMEVQLKSSKDIEEMRAVLENRSMQKDNAHDDETNRLRAMLDEQNKQMQVRQSGAVDDGIMCSLRQQIESMHFI